ncbi:MAG: hypothetical protein RIT28_704 [Pseudomonadota bacterium]|jgi:hypothetical protein
MSKPTRVPFFARFIETEAPAINTNVRAGADGDTNPWANQTKKYPCDGDDTYSTLKGGTEYDEKW